MQQREPPSGRICPGGNSAISPIRLPGMPTEGTNRMTYDVRDFTSPNCGYQDTEAYVDERVRIGEEVSGSLSS
jgi:hypothetical protein